MAGIDTPYASRADLLVGGEVRWSAARLQRYPHGHRESAVDVRGEIAVSNEDIVLQRNGQDDVAVRHFDDVGAAGEHDYPGLIVAMCGDLLGGLRDPHHGAPIE